MYFCLYFEIITLNMAIFPSRKGKQRIITVWAKNTEASRIGICFKDMKLLWILSECIDFYNPFQNYDYSISS